MNRSLTRDLNQNEINVIAGGNAGSSEVMEEQIETVMVTGSAFTGGSLSPGIGFSLASGGGQSFWGKTWGIGAASVFGYAATSKNASREADNAFEGLKVCWAICSDIKLEHIGSSDFVISGSFGVGIFYGQSNQIIPQ